MTGIFLISTSRMHGCDFTIVWSSTFELKKSPLTRIVTSNEEIKMFLNKATIFYEHGLLVVPQASLRLKSISDTTKCTTGRRAVSAVVFDEIILLRPQIV